MFRYLPYGFIVTGLVLFVGALIYVLVVPQYGQYTWSKKQRKLIRPMFFIGLVLLLSGVLTLLIQMD